MKIPVAKTSGFSSTEQKRNTLARTLGLLDPAAVVIGVMIGTSIFLVPGSVARQLSPLAGVSGIWIVGGILSFFGGLSLAELGASLPEVGDLYINIERAYGRFAGFLYG